MSIRSTSQSGHINAVSLSVTCLGVQAGEVVDDEVRRPDGEEDTEEAQEDDEQRVDGQHCKRGWGHIAEAASFQHAPR